MGNRHLLNDNQPGDPGKGRSKNTIWAVGIIGFAVVWIILIAAILRLLGTTRPQPAVQTPNPPATAGGEKAPTKDLGSAPKVAPTKRPITAPTGTQNTLAWFSEEIDNNPKTGIFSSLVIAQDGTQYAAYFDDFNDDLKLATKKGSNWYPESIVGTSEGKDGFYPSLALDRRGELHISYFSYKKQQVMYSSRSSTGIWNYETAASNISVLDTSLAIGADDAPYIVYFDETDNQVVVAVKTAKGWTSSLVSQADPAGVVYPAAVDPNNRLHVIFKGKTGGLFYASLLNNAWKLEAVDNGEGAGSYPSLAFDRSGNPHISYYDSAGQDLKYAYRDGGKWQAVTVDSDGDVGKFSSTAIDDFGNAHVSYYDEGNAALKYAYGQAGQWKIFRANNDGHVGKYTALILEQNNPRIAYYDEGARVFMLAFADIYKNDPPPARISAVHRAGQTFLTWYERSDISHESYQIYRSDTPINKDNIRQAALLAQVGEQSSIFWANYHDDGGVWRPRLSEYLITENGGAGIGKGKGAFIWTISPEDTKGKSEATGYYAVTMLEEGSNTELFFDAYVTGPVQETLADPQPVEITTSPGLFNHAEQGGHFYIQYMDFRRWNPTFHAPNSTNKYYGFDPGDPRIPRALAYAYDYTVYEPTPGLCGGNIPDSLPIMLFLHGARGNRYGAPDKYPYPYCAYGVYPIDESETWYFGFARQHDYRSDSAFAPDDVIENYTEQRILRMVYDLIRNPPGPKVDTQRVYLFGHSMGGTGSLAFAERYPNVFAAIYSGQPVTQFYATEGFSEDWPENLATKWGPQAFNLPILISAPNHWADHLQKYNGAGVFEWENLRAAFDPSDRLGRLREDMVPLGIDHGTMDDAVLFPTQGQPLYPLLNASGLAWAGAVTAAKHQWSDFGWPLPDFAMVDDIPFWGFRVIRDETVPGLSFLSGNNPRLPDRPTTYNQTILWSASWNAWDGKPVDRPNEWQMSFCAVKEGSQECGGSPLQVDITPRRLQQFAITPGKTYRWENRRLPDNSLVEKGDVQADASGLLTIRQVHVFPEGNRLRIFLPGE